MKMLASHRWLLIAFFLAGCVGTPARPNTPPTVVTLPERPLPPDDAPLKVALDSSLGHYRVESRTIVFATSDTTIPLDSILVVAQIGVSAKHLIVAGAILFSGTVEMLTVTSGLGASRSSQSLNGEFRMDWSTVADSLAFPGQPTRAGCDQLQETARDILVSVFPLLPGSLTPNQIWRSRGTLRSCRAGVVMEIASRSQIAVASGTGTLNRRQVSLRSDGTVSIGGSGTQGAGLVTVRGSGVHTSTYSLNLEEGILVSTTTQSRTQIEFDMGYRTDRLIQRTMRSISRIR